MTVKVGYYCLSCGCPLEPDVRSDTYVCRACGMVWKASYLAEVEAKGARKKKKEKFIFR